MWMLHPTLLCRQHLLGEHGELHKHRPSFVKRYAVTGRIAPIVQIEPEAMQKRHDELAQEMTARGMSHRSPYAQPDLSYLPYAHRYAKVDPAVSMADLAARCPACAVRINEFK